MFSKSEITILIIKSEIQDKNKTKVITFIIYNVHLKLAKCLKRIHQFLVSFKNDEHNVYHNACNGLCGTTPVQQFKYGTAYFLVVLSLLYLNKLRVRPNERNIIHCE